MLEGEDDAGLSARNSVPFAFLVPAPPPVLARPALVWEAVCVDVVAANGPVVRTVETVWLPIGSSVDAAEEEDDAGPPARSLVPFVFLVPA